METKEWPLKTIFRIIVLLTGIVYGQPIRSNETQSVAENNRASTACRRRDVPSYLIPSSFSTRHPFHPPSTLTYLPLLPSIPAILLLHFRVWFLLTIFASPLWFIRNTSILRPVVHVKSHSIPFSFPANNRAVRTHERLLFLFTEYSYSMLFCTRYISDIHYLRAINASTIAI